MIPSDLIPTGRTKSRKYIRVRLLGHPNSGKDGYVYEHRFMMEKTLGRFLLPDEVVHHKNGDPTDNRLENLELMTDGDHSSRHHRRKVKSQCPICKQDFYRAPCRFISKVSYCSRRCFHKSMRGVKRKVSSVSRQLTGLSQWTHGTSVAYGYHGCRCDRCREAHRIRLGNYRFKKKHPGIS